MNPIYVLGSINMDLVFEIERLPEKGETMQGKHFMMSPGGKGANQAVAAARQNAKTYMIGSLGGDPLSEKLLKTLEGYNVDTRHVSIHPEKTSGVAGILLEGGDNRIITDSGANAHQDLSVIRSIIQQAQKASLLIAQLEIPVEAVQTAFKEARDKGMTTILNAAPAIPLPDELYPLIDILVVNEGEARTLSGVDASDPAFINQAAKALMKKGARSLLFTLGEKGSLYIGDNGTIEVPAYTVEVKDTTAAGDTFIGVFAAAFAQGRPLEETLRRANAASALTVQTLGAQRAIPEKETVDTFINTHTLDDKD